MAILGDTKAISLTLLDGVKGTLKVTNNGNTLSIGSENSSWCHFKNSANVNFYFNHQIHADGGFVVYGTNTSLTDNTLALSGGGGWYMTDTTWIRSRGSKSVYVDSGILRTDGTFLIGPGGVDVNFGYNANKTIGNTTRTTNNVLTLNGKLVINPLYDLSANSYNEGVRANMGSNAWTCFSLGGDAGSTSGTSKAVWALATYRHDTTNKVSNFYITNNGNASATMRLTGHVTSAAELGWSIRPRLGIGMDPDTSFPLAVNGHALILGNIYYSASSATYAMISFRDGGQYGHGVTIGGGACTIVGGGESAALTALNVTASSETLELTSDGNVYIRTNLQDNWASGKTFTFDASGNLTVPISITAGSNITASGNICVTGTGNGNGISLYSSVSQVDTYGIHFSLTGNFGRYGDVQSDWATYFTMNANNQRGWIWKATGSALAQKTASLSSRGVFTVPAVGAASNYIAYPQGGLYSANEVTGAMKITLPTKETNTMINFTVSIATYVKASNIASSLAEYHIYGYCYSSDGWYNSSLKAYSTGIGPYTNLPVRWGIEGDHVCIIIGDVDTYWSYPNIDIKDVCLGHTNPYIYTWGYGWSITPVTTLPTITKTISTNNTQDINITGNAATATAATSAVTATSASCIKAPAVLTTQEAIDGFLSPSTLQYALFKTTEANNIGMASNDGMLISLPWSSNAYGALIALDDLTTGVMKFRGKSNTWGDWRTIIHDGNYTSYTVTKTGTGATGTWGIGITGNANTATALTSNAGSATQPIYFTGGKPAACSYTLGTNIVYQIHNATTGFWSAAYGMYNAAPVISVTRHNATVPTYIPGSYASTLVYGGIDTKGMLSINYNSPIITFGGAATTGSTANEPTWWIKLTGTKSTTYNLDNVGKTGSSNNVAEMYIIGATSLAAAVTTYSKSAVKMTSANCVIAASFKAANGTNGCEMIYDANSKSIKFVFS